MNTIAMLDIQVHTAVQQVHRRDTEEMARWTLVVELLQDSTQSLSARVHVHWYDCVCSRLTYLTSRARSRLAWQLEKWTNSACPCPSRATLTVCVRDGRIKQVKWGVVDVLSTYIHAHYTYICTSYNSYLRTCMTVSSILDAV